MDPDEALQDILSNPQQAQARMKNVYDRGHRKVEFSLGSYVWFRMHPYRQSLWLSKYYGPFEVGRLIG